MYIVEVWVEYAVFKINQKYSYFYETEISIGVRVNVTFNNRLITGFVADCYFVEDLELEEAKLGYKLLKVSEIIDAKAIINNELLELAEYIAYTTVSPLISVLHTMLPSSLKPKKNYLKVVKTAWVRKLKYHNFKNKNWERVYNDFTSDITQKEFNQKYKSVGKNLLADKAFEIYYRDKEYQLDIKFVEDNKKKLTLEQDKVLNQISNSEKRVSLLYGITGSGKTEIYLQLAADLLKERKQVLILVPEIALTPLMIKRVKSRFKDLAIYHSGLNSQEKYYQYQRVLHNEVQIVVGTRSSIFMPFSNLGLIIIDEEHDSSYKQEKTPAYHTRDVAIKRAEHFNAKVLLASATPSLESFSRGVKGVYNLVSLRSRISPYSQELKVIDMKKELDLGLETILALELVEDINIRLKRKEQVMILLNRRGYSPVLKCNECHEVIKCDHCDLAMSYHRDIKKLKCHYCDYERDIPEVCPNCNQVASFTSYGFGIQKLETELNQFFPDYRILRMDADTTKKKNSHAKILEAFENHEADILCGTQMIAKGLDFENVTLVAVVNADDGLIRNDFRSVESCFDLINQAAGRSGRGAKKGLVVLQVNEPEHYAVQMAIKNNYVGFFKEEMNFRHLLNYPPYSYLIAIYFSDINRSRLEKSVAIFLKYLNNEVEIMGPSDLLKLNKLLRKRIIVKSKDLNKMIKLVQNANIAYNEENLSRNWVDVNPIHLE